MSKKILVVTVIIAGLLLTGVLLYKSRHKNPPGVIQIGAVLPLTGPGAPFGASSRNSLLLALDEINESPDGPRFSLQIEDGMTDVKSSVSAFNRLHDAAGIRHFITTVSSVSLALAPLADQKGVVLFANASHPQVTEGRNFVLRYSPTAGEEAEVVYKFVGDQQRGWKNVYIIALNDDYGRAYEAAVRSAQAKSPGVNFLGSDFYDAKISDFRTVTAKAVSTNPDAILLVGFGRSLGLIIRQLREVGYMKPFVASLGLVATPDAITSAGESIRGGFFVNFDFVNGKAADAFRDKYRKRYGTEANPTALVDYGTLYLIAQAVKSVGSDPQRVKDALRNAGTVQLPTGPVSITNGDIVPPVFISAVPADGAVDLWRRQQ